MPRVLCPYRFYNIIPTAYIAAVPILENLIRLAARRAQSSYFRLNSNSVRKAAHKSLGATHTAYPSERPRASPLAIHTIHTLTAHVGRFTTGLAAGLCSIRVHARVYIMRKPHFFVTRRAAAAAALPFYKRTRASSRARDERPIRKINWSVAGTAQSYLRTSFSSENFAYGKLRVPLDPRARVFLINIYPVYAEMVSKKTSNEGWSSTTSSRAKPVVDTPRSRRSPPPDEVFQRVIHYLGVPALAKYIAELEKGGHPCPGRLQPGEGEAPPRPAVPGPHSARSSGDPPATQRLEGQEGEREVGLEREHEQLRRRSRRGSCAVDSSNTSAQRNRPLLSIDAPAPRRKRARATRCRTALFKTPPPLDRPVERPTYNKWRPKTWGYLKSTINQGKLHCCEEEYHAHHNSPADEENYPETESDHTEPQKEGDKPITSESE
ncbi:unnamed protein product [Trichogramma brassicae]|uniref:Uncharacterized protein n=1 Tax=Trichogramma brassicae TaxID=86971 RepID=A0A6H5IKU3_9HYME|nr:unnamed protein product [Trichogramma brassicae]